MPLNEPELPDKVAYHSNVRCVRGGGGEGPVIVGRMYRVLGGEGYVCEEEATPEEKAKDPVEPAKNFRGDQVEGLICAAGQRLTSKRCVAPTASLT